MTAAPAPTGSLLTPAAAVDPGTAAAATARSTDSAAALGSADPTATKRQPAGAPLPSAEPLLVVEGLVKHYRLPRERLFAAPPQVQALRGVSFAVEAGRSLGVVGESGSGKSTLARLVMALERPTAGRVTLLGRDLNALAPAALRAARRDFQMVFQDPYGSLDPRQTVARIVAEPLGTMLRGDARRRVGEALDAVGLRATDAEKYPHEFSGGQRQRIAIARALITRPRLIVADEPVSALDVSVQAQVLNLLQDLQAEFGVTLLLISHDLAVVDHLCAEVVVLYAGCVVEQGSPEVLFRSAAHPYTRALMAAVPPSGVAPVQRRGSKAVRAADGGAAVAAVGAIAVAPLDSAAATAALAGTASGCAYAARCQHRQPLCTVNAPRLRPVTVGHLAACHLAESVMAEARSPQDRR